MQQCNTNTQIIIICGLKFGLQFQRELQKMQKKKKKEQYAAHTFIVMQGNYLEIYGSQLIYLLVLPLSYQSIISKHDV